MLCEGGEIVNVSVENLTVKYKEVTAVNDISFKVDSGEIFAVIGPNGAGKTTTIECIEGLKKPTKGKIEVLGMDPLKDRKELYKHIGIQLQESAYPDKIKVEEVCRLFSSFYDKPIDYNKLLKELILEDKKSKYVTSLSGGEKQRLSILLALLPRPKLLCIDEITTGLDPMSRRYMWNLIKEVNNQGTTILITTHFMDEVEYLCHKVMIMNKGKIIAKDSVNGLIKNCGISQKVMFDAVYMDDIDFKNLSEITGVKKIINTSSRFIILGNREGLENIVFKYLQMRKISYKNLIYSTPNFEDVFLELVGYEMGEGYESIL